MSDIRKPKAELRAFIYWEGLWRHVYILSGYDQMSLIGEPEKMLEFKLSLKTKISYAAPKTHFHQKKPSDASRRRNTNRQDIA